MAVGVVHEETEMISRQDVVLKRTHVEGRSWSVGKLI